MAAMLMRRWHRKQDEILNTSITGQQRLRPAELAVIPEDVLDYLRERALIIASLLARSASEICSTNSGATGPSSQVITRQVQNGILRERGLWAKLEQQEFDLAIKADGLWTPEQHAQVIEWCEQLRLLRWILGVDAEIMPLAHFPKLDFSLAVQFLRDSPVRRDRQPVESWEVQMERNTALQYAARIVAEMNARGNVPDDPDNTGWADEFRAKSLGDSTDYLAGPKTIADLNDHELRLLGSFAVARERYAAYLAEQLNSTQAFAFATWQMKQQRA